MGVEEDPIPRLDVTDDFAREYVERGGSPYTVGDVNRDSGSRRVRVYYRGADAIVTSDRLVLPPMGGQTLRLADLTNVRLVRVSPRLRSLLAVAAAVVFPLGVAGVVGSALADGMTTKVVVIAAVTIAVGSLSYLARRWVPQRWELWGEYRGEERILYSTVDSRMFNLVARALRRALENSKPCYFRP